MLQSEKCGTERVNARDNDAVLPVGMASIAHSRDFNPLPLRYQLVCLGLPVNLKIPAAATFCLVIT